LTGAAPIDTGAPSVVSMGEPRRTRYCRCPSVQLFLDRRAFAVAGTGAVAAVIYHGRITLHEMCEFLQLGRGYGKCLDAVTALGEMSQPSVSVGTCWVHSHTAGTRVRETTESEDLPTHPLVLLPVKALKVAPCIFAMFAWQ